MTEIVLDGGVPHIGLPGLEAIHTWDDGAVVFNNWMPNTGNVFAEGAIPRLKLRRLGGFRSRPEFDNNIEPRVGMTGEYPRLSFLRGKTITYEGTIQASSLHELRSYQGALVGALSVGDERRMDVAIRDDYAVKLFLEGVSDISTAYYFYARPIDLAMDDDFSNASLTRPFAGGFESDFVATFRMSDPRFYDGAEHRVNVAHDTANICTNNGNAPTDPIINLWGPYSHGGALLRRDADGSPSLNMSRAGAFTGFFFALDFAQRKVIDPAGGDQRRLLDLANSSWWDAGVAGLLPGDNIIQWILATDTTGFSLAEVVWHNAFWG